MAARKAKRVDRSMIYRIIIAENRTPEDYFGISSKSGHIRALVNLPIPWTFAST
jgi:hypothetical protein